MQVITPNRRTAAGRPSRAGATALAAKATAGGAAVAAALLLAGCGSAKPDTCAGTDCRPASMAAAQATTTTAAPTTTPPPTTTTTTTTTTTRPKPTTTTRTPKPIPVANGTPCSSTAAACVDLATHRAWLLSNGHIAYGPVPAEPGRPDAPTQPGTFHVLWKDKDHKSTEFNNAPMPWSVFFNSNGSAFHTGSLNTLSHGCVHLSDPAAERFFNFLSVGDVVQVVVR